MKTIREFIETRKTLKEDDEKPRSKALLAVGTNDWDDEEKAYQGAKSAIQSVKDRGEDPVLVLPNKSVRGKGNAHTGASRAAAEHGIETHYPSEFGQGDDHYHLTQKAADEIKAKYPGAKAYGDSNSIRLGAKEGETGFTGKGGNYISGKIKGSSTQPQTIEPPKAPKPPKEDDKEEDQKKTPEPEKQTAPSKPRDTSSSAPAPVSVPTARSAETPKLPPAPTRQSDTDYQSTGQSVTKSGSNEINWGSNDSAADFFRASKAFLAMKPKSSDSESIAEDAPVNAAGGGNIASIGVPNPLKGSNFGEPGFSPSAMSKHKKRTKKGQEDIEQDLAMMRRAQPALVGGKLMEAKMGKFAGHDTFIVPSDVYHKARHEKKKGKHWKTYIGEDDCGCAIREYASKNKKKPIILQDENTGAMCYARYGK